MGSLMSVDAAAAHSVSLNSNCAYDPDDRRTLLIFVLPFK